MRRIALFFCFFVALTLLALQLPLGNFVKYANDQFAAVLMSREEYGARLGVTVDEVVKSIRYQDKKNGEKSYITHRHIMALMCQENPWLNIRINNRQGFSRGGQEGLTQVIDATAWRLLNSPRFERGRCLYVRNLENGVCADLRARVNNPRCSIELGACYYNEKLKQARGNPYYAFVGYNTGSIYKAYKANGLSSFVRGYNALASGKLCAKARANPQTWIAMYKKIYELTGGTFKTDDAEHIPVSSMNWPKDPSKWPTPRNIAQSWWDSPAGRAVAQSLGRGVDEYDRERQRQEEEARRLAEQRNREEERRRWLDSLFGKNKYDNMKAKAFLSCDLNTDGTVVLRWSCPSGTTMSKGFGVNGSGFDTSGAGAGMVISDVYGDEEYVLQCLRGYEIYAEQRCTISADDNMLQYDNGVNTADDEVLRNIIPDGVFMDIKYNNGNVMWATSGTEYCIIMADRFEKSGLRGIMRIGIPRENTLIKLDCDSKYGRAVKYKQIMVR